MCLNVDVRLPCTGRRVVLFVSDNLCVLEKEREEGRFHEGIRGVMRNGCTDTEG